MKRINISTDTDWEDRVGYSRAVRVGNRIEISGTTATNKDGEIVGLNDPHQQTIQSIQNIESALEQVDATLEDVIRTRLFVTDITQWEKIANAHAEYFQNIRPATSMFEVQHLIDPDILVEIEAVAITEGHHSPE